MITPSQTHISSTSFPVHRIVHEAVVEMTVMMAVAVFTAVGTHCMPAGHSDTYLHVPHLTFTVPV